MRRILLLAPLVLQEPMLAQTCDSLTIDSLLYAPFGGGLHVTLHNGSAQMLSGPMIDVLDAGGDTVVLNAFNFFAIGPGWTQLHQLPLAFGAAMPASPFTGSLVLSYADVDGAHTCVFPLDNVDLCPVGPCAPLAVFAYLQGGSAELDLGWSVSDAQNSTLASGTLQVDTSGFGYALAAICLPPGTFTLHVQQGAPAGHIVHVGLTRADLAWNEGIHTLLPNSEGTVVPFSFFDPCHDDAQGMITLAEMAPVIVLNGRQLSVFTNDRSPLGLVLLVDGLGRITRSTTTFADRIDLELSGLAPGTYIVRSVNRHATRAQSVILH